MNQLYTKRIFLLLLVLAIMALSSCKKLLEKEPSDFVQPQNYFNSEADLNLALAGVYDPLGSEYLYASGLWFQFGNCTDESFYPNSANAFAAPMFYQYDYTNSYVSGLWEQCYIGIERANLLIENVSKPVMDEKRRQAILGEALFLRGFYHFMLVSNYGDIPLKLASTKSVNVVEIPRTPSAQVYAQVLKDMQDAELKVNKASTIGNSSRISQTTVEGMLARVCLYMAGNPLNDKAKYADALSWAQKVVISGENALLTTPNLTYTNSPYSQIFINEAQDVYDVKECMWEADFNMFGNNTAFSEGGRLGTYGIACNNLDTGYASSNVRTTIKLYNLYQTADRRRDWAIAPFTYTSTTTSATRVPYAATAVINRACGKWRRSFEPLSSPKQQFKSGQNFPILRYADVLLMLAEAENEVNGPTATAYNAINSVRRRGYALPVNVASAVADLAPGLSKNSFRQAIMDERARELCFEALRKPDLIRWGVFTQVMSATAAEINGSNATATNKALWSLGYNTAASSSRYLLLPIPALEINVNRAMTQNPGW
ncbi:RagB/SusD family nutrient uptake outer membrane protein [Mucilaginibacter sp. PAMB04274]|uniref:RagB/SusD family nutrient uptake outer membrane protein n=1 Tax=Mucilaginibacter sp. PAMB04274 TaxID=3138568 RepID=UPI0031F6D63B